MMAEKIERYGAEFYGLASKSAYKKEACIGFQKLQSMENEHARLFSDMKEKYSQSDNFSINNGNHKVVNFLKTIQDSRVFDFSRRFDKLITGYETVKDVVNIAIALEKDSIVFYSGLANIISEKTFNDVLAEIIREELNHLSILTDIPVY